MVYKSTLIAAGAGLAGAAIIGYCIYFDKKRRSDPNYKQKIKEKRSQARSSKSSSSNKKSNPFPDFKDPAQMQNFFLQEVQLGEELLAEGEFDAAVDHLCNAVTLCGQPDQLLMILEQTLPPQVYAMMVQRLPQANRRMMSAANAAFGHPPPQAGGLFGAAAGGPADALEEPELE